ncbi:hypothetical protein BDR04DRAFT_1155910 [Suillus decipiens]|nr:hypothetical protein BDR04DRAFT_1155910 [Suillus decipiens]
MYLTPSFDGGLSEGEKPKRQMNLDYALCQALSYNTNGIDWALTFYDINCQYHKHLQQWVDVGSGMSMAIKTNAMCSTLEYHITVGKEDVNPPLKGTFGFSDE